jgi:hypothetical protein
MASIFKEGKIHLLYKAVLDYDKSEIAVGCGYV